MSFGTDLIVAILDETSIHSLYNNTDTLTLHFLI
jgi:hypothetical protein